MAAEKNYGDKSIGQEGDGDIGADNDMLIKRLFEEYSELDRSAYDAQAEILMKMISLDKSNSEWHYLLYTTKKYQRKSTQTLDGTFSLPSREEILAIAKASDLDPDNPKIILGRCNVMLDFVRHHSVYWIGTACFGMGHFFTDADAIVESVQQEARRALALDPNSDVVNIGVFEIFGTGLPPKLRQPEYALECLNNAVTRNPDSSRAHSRIASYYFQSAGVVQGQAAAGSDQERNLQLAEKHYLRAVEIERENLSITSLIDLLQTVYLTRNTAKLEQLLETNINDPDWDDIRRSKLYFVKGLHDFSQDEGQKGFDAWVNSYNLDKRVVDKMKFLDRDGFRYGWPGTLKAEKIFASLGQLKRSGTLSCELSRILVQFRESLGTQAQVPSTTKEIRGHRRK